MEKTNEKKLLKKHLIKSWMEIFMETFMVYFPADQIHIIDGENMAHNAQIGFQTGARSLIG